MKNGLSPIYDIEVFFLNFVLFLNLAQLLSFDFIIIKLQIYF